MTGSARGSDFRRNSFFKILLRLDQRGENMRAATAS